MPAALATPAAARRAVAGASCAAARPAVAVPSARRAGVAVAPALAARGNVHPDPSTPLYPGFQEEKDVSHEAFMHAMEAARPRAMRLPGMQEFAASLWGRRKIPSQTYTDPLDHIFTEFDTDNDGKLTAREVAAALNSRGVDATEEQVQMFIDASDSDDDGLVGRNEFSSFIFHMASADVRSVSSFAEASAPAPASAKPHIVLPPRMGGSGPGDM